ncbi:phosphatidylserine decarboxylase [Runella salmonicolor]|uniref:Phosphatidylserine decarboxylase n=1 Tax=Runella salmonicolor TaxID=2950278 RepID=A0ABT1FIR1_9BACT|nr:phosphatidylserine decarboxylase [Runella salmonicolor]MCP1381655.1 phosphatidylserine decarboxylase [Runella salmonicolor]
MSKNAQYHPVVTELADLITKYNWEQKFEEAIKKAGTKNIPLLKSVTDIPSLLDWYNDLLYWQPRENSTGKDVYNHLCASYFIIDQEPVLSLQTKLLPHQSMPPITPFSQWIVNYANAMGAFMDTPESLTPEYEATFYASPAYNMSEYIRPNGGWKTFNQFFARNFKPGYRPVAAVENSAVVVFPADCTFAGQWEIRADSHVTIKNLHWQISELMEGSPYKDRFKNGIFMHAFLNTTDYHRLHAPVGGKVLESRVIQGQAYLEVDAIADLSNNGILLPKRHFDAPDSPGYQFDQTRGLVVIESSVGLVAVLPMGMCQVSSVITTAEVGVTLRKGEELAYFQFGGSDIVLLFESATNLSITAQPNVHYKMGTRLGMAFPVC